MTVWLAILFYWRRALRGWRRGWNGTSTTYRWRRCGTLVVGTNRYAEYFQRNLMAIRAEERRALAGRR